MNRFLKTTIIFLFFSVISYAQSINVIEGKKFRGAIFPSTYKNSAYTCFENENRFTPTNEEVLNFEKKLYRNLKIINVKRLNQKGKCPVIQNNLSSYVRQYLGFIDESGKKYLLVNFLWIDSVRDEIPNDAYYNELADWRKSWQVWFDGCSHFWNVKYYLESETLFDLHVNGSE